LDALIAGLFKIPIIEGVDVLDKHANTMISKRGYTLGSVPSSILETQSNSYWTLHEEKTFLGSVTLYSLSGVILDRVPSGFSLISIVAIIKLSILFGLFL
jgi:hypothetical protein